MRIGFDAKRAFLNSSGLGNYSRYTISALSRFYPENEYLLYSTAINSNELFTPPEKSSLKLPSSISARMFRKYWRTFSIIKDLKKDDIHLFHGLSNELPYGIRESGVKSIVTIHDLIFMRLPELYRSPDKKIYTKKSRLAVQNADRIIAISEQTKRDLVELLDADEKNIRVIYQGCHPWFYEACSAEEKERIKKKYALPETYLLYIGTIEERKNLLGIVRAIHQAKINLPLVAVGRQTPYFNEVKKYIEANKMKNFHFIPFISSNDLPAMYQLAHAFIYPSIYEGFGIPVLEALNSGIPVVTSRGGCLEETVGKGGILADPYDQEELAESILKVVSDTELRKRLVENGKKHALNFREEKTIPQVMELYKEILND